MTRSRLARRLAADEGGFTLVIVLAVMAVVVLFSVGAFAAVNGDLPGSGEDVTSKQAMGAAEAGVSDYLFRLNDDSAYWTRCTAAGPGLNDPWTTAKPPASTNWRTVPGTTTRYAIELLPAAGSGYTACDPNPDNVADSMLDPATRSIRIRVTGEATGSKGIEHRSVIASLRRTNFLDYLYFTDYETSDPVWWQRFTKGHASTSSQGDLPTWAAGNCVRYYRPAPAGAGGSAYNRPGPSWSGWIDFNDNGRSDSGESKSYSCTDLDIQFASDDAVLGPMHTNDEMLVCNGFTMGRNTDDRIESGRSWRPCDGRSSTKPNVQGTFVPNAQTLKLPPTDASLAAVAASNYTFTGKTTIKLNQDSTITVTNAALNGGNPKTMAYPPNGVIYVKNGTNPPCGYGYQPLNPYNQSGTAWNNAYAVPAGCGDAWVSGTYNTGLTIAAQDDLIVTGDVKRLSTSDARLGLIADNFIRVEHPVTRSSSDPTSCTEPSGSSRINGRQIDAAILSLQHSFMVDNYYCGGLIGTLTINGIIAQKFRGAVGTSGGTGFIKDYNYDQRLAYKGPPHFLDPVQSAWKVRAYTEQQPAR